MKLDEILKSYYTLSDDALYENFLTAVDTLMHTAEPKEYLAEDEGLPQTYSKEAKSFVLSLPKFSPSEAWGDPNSEARDLMEKFFRQIGGGADVTKKLKYLQRLSAAIPTKGREISSPRRIISTLILLESLSACFNSFNDSAAGFVFEGFLAALLGGHQVSDPEDGSLPIEDIVAFSTYGSSPDVPMSLKALKRTTNVKGSYTNLVNALNSYPEMKYIIAFKDKVGDDVGAVEVAEFTLSRTNLLEVLAINLAGRRCLVLPGKSFQQSYDFLATTVDNWEVFYAYLQRTAGYGKTPTVPLPDEEEEVSVTDIEAEEPVEDIQPIPEYKLPRAALSILTEAAAKEGRGMGWHISPTELQRLAGGVAYAHLATLAFNKEKLYKIAERYMKVLNPFGYYFKPLLIYLQILMAILLLKKGAPLSIKAMPP